MPSAHAPCHWPSPHSGCSGFIVTQTFPMMRQSDFLNELVGGGFSFWLYAVLTFLSLLIVLRYVPETKGKTLEELEKASPGLVSASVVAGWRVKACR
ncbi:MFS transporter [Cobetia sp. ICG0124]|uniref:MFS transporter n=1 Tax=Cobetia sp. ICG0124 TaxID=2053669 RepID=UPI001F0CCDC8|nr:MFS transporter [Cobetia sp. ICG0124]